MLDIYSLFFFPSLYIIYTFILAIAANIVDIGRMHKYAMSQNKDSMGFFNQVQVSCYFYLGTRVR